ncbi:MAG TPA: hypothetical protein VLS90_10055 [Thermodesulfobacteriota bacterium]|nr:hypothetical protein [Thermodesulfobacteriota bacterium]
MKNVGKSLIVPGLAALLLVYPAVGAAQSGYVLLAGTIGPIDSGIVGALEDAFEKESPR